MWLPAQAATGHNVTLDVGRREVRRGAGHTGAMVGGQASEDAAELARPLLRVVRGTPTDADVAALTAVLLSRTGAAATDADPVPGTLPGWAARADGLRGTPAPGPAAWRSSGREPGSRTRADW